MAITVQYNPSLAAGGQLAFESGRGRFLQAQDQYNAQRLDADRGYGLNLAQFLEGQQQFDETQGLREAQFGEGVRQFDETQDLRESQFGEGVRQFDLGHELRRDQFGEGIRQFDEGLDQRQSEYDRNLRMKADLARMQDSQFQDQLGQRADQYDRGLLERRYLQERGIQGDLMGQAMRQRGMQQYQQGQLGMQREGIEARERMTLSSNLSRLDQQQQEQMYRTAMASASAIETFKNYRTPEQKQQAIDQWLGQYGELTEGQFPFTTPFVQSKQFFSKDQAVSQAAGVLGPGFEPDEVDSIVSSMSTLDENGELKWEIEDPVQRQEEFRWHRENKRKELEKIADTKLAEEQAVLASREKIREEAAAAMQKHQEQQYTREQDEIKRRADLVEKIQADVFKWRMAQVDDNGGLKEIDPAVTARMVADQLQQYDAMFNRPQGQSQPGQPQAAPGDLPPIVLTNPMAAGTLPDGRKFILNGTLF